MMQNGWSRYAWAGWTLPPGESLEVSDGGAFDIFNDRYFGQEPSPSCPTCTSVPSSFPLFPDLPKELRLKIWTWHLRQRRFFRVLLEEEEVNPDPNLGIQIKFLDTPTSSVPALPLVCRESYESYMSFYPIRLPAVAIVSAGSDSKRIVAHLHPNLDILSLQTPGRTDIIELNLLPLFLSALVQYDFSPAHRRFGIRNLCVDLVPFSRDHALWPVDPSPLAPDVLASVRLTVSHLRNLFLRLTTSHLQPRVLSGPLMSSRRPWYNASVPILPHPSWGFSGVVESVEGGDPRLNQPEGQADLHQVWIGDRVRPCMDVWAGLEHAWGAHAGAEVADGVRIRALVALDGHSLARNGRYGQSLREALHEEHTAWLTLLDPKSDVGRVHLGLFENAQQLFLPGSGDDPANTLTPEEWFLRRRPHTAVGFWLVDPEALEAAKTTTVTGKNVADLSGTGREAIELWVLEGHS